MYAEKGRFGFTGIFFYSDGNNPAVQQSSVNTNQHLALFSWNLVNSLLETHIPLYSWSPLQIVYKS